MRLRACCAVAALALGFASVAPFTVVMAQTPQTTDQDHKAHHPEGSNPVAPAPAKPDGMGAMGQGAMMCGDMKQMMSMMQGMMGMMTAQSGMMSSRIESEITRLKSELTITDAQAPHWNRFSDALRRLAKSMDEMHQERAMLGMGPTLPDRFARLERALLGYLNAVRSTEEAVQPLYSSLSDQQRKIADKIRLGPMGMM